MGPAAGLGSRDLTRPPTLLLVEFIGRLEIEEVIVYWSCTYPKCMEFMIRGFSC